MDLELTTELEEFRESVRVHIDAHRPLLPRLPGTRSPAAADLPAYRAWCASLFAAGFLGAEWPAQWGGHGLRDPLRDLIVDDELAEAKAPRPVGSWNLICGALLDYGTSDQRAYYLPRIRRFEDIWCQLFSEPDAGSDLASLRTSARPDGGGWVVNGQKVWTTHAHIADLGFLLARTEPDAEKHAGLSAFIIDMRTPGVDVRPLREMTGSSDFSEVFFDDARLPAAALLGERGRGWEIARGALSHERTQSLREDSVTDKARRLVRLAAQRDTAGASLLDSADVRQSLGTLFARSQASELLGFENVLKEAAGTSRPYDAAVMKVLFSDTNLDIAAMAVGILGADGILADGDREAIDDGYWQQAFLFARGFTISAGSNEIMRNIIAERGLGLPRGS